MKQLSERMDEENDECKAECSISEAMLMKRSLLAALVLVCGLVSHLPAAGVDEEQYDPPTFTRLILEVVDIIEEGHFQPVGKGQMVEWAIRGLYEQLGKKIPVPIEKRLVRVKLLPQEDLRTLLVDARRNLEPLSEAERIKAFRLTLTAMLSRMDPNTRYVTPENKKPFASGETGYSVGVGLHLTALPNGKVRILTPVKGSPAYKAGLRADDRITHIIRDQDSYGRRLKQSEVIAIAGLQLGKVTKLILGEPETKVKLRVESDRRPTAFEVELNRAVSPDEVVLGYRRLKNDDQDYWLDTKNRIGYIRVSHFGRNSAASLGSALDTLEREGLKGLILDLRLNPGGSVDQAIKITDLFIEDQLIVMIKPRIGKTAVFNGQKEGSHLALPMVCLVNGQTASAGEVTAAALQDHHRGTIVGERTRGKASVQNVEDLGEGEVYVTTAAIFRPSGASLDRWVGNKDKPDAWG